MIIIKKPVITEKMTAISEKLNRFAFIVDKNANKYQIKDAIEKLYDVKVALDLRICPVMCGSSFKNKCVQPLLDAIVNYLPSPLDIDHVKGINPKTEQEEIRKADPKEPFCALAFKIATDPFVGRLCFFRVYSGTLKAGEMVLNVSTGKRERIAKIVQMHANR